MASTRRKKSTGKKRTTKTTRTTRTTKKRASSGKVYIPAYKTIILCLSVIVICLVLLLINTLPKTKTLTQDSSATSIAERFEEEKKQPEPEKLSSPEIKLENKNTQTKQEPKKVEPEKPKTQPKTEAVKTEPAKKEEPKKVEEKKQEQKKSEPAVKSFGFEKAKKNAQLIFVFDDGGQNLEQLKRFLALPFPITVAVLPQITHSVEAANLVRKSGNEVILHQPMQSVNANINPGPGAITPDMTDDQIVSQLFVNINQIAPIAGMNNHEGSGITADAEKMAVILQMASESGIYFLDSRTNVETKVPYVAKEMGYTWYERNIFLDNEKTRENALAELKKGLALANKNGSVIMIGHIWSADFLPALLEEVYPELKQKGYTFSVVSKSNAEKR